MPVTKKTITDKHVLYLRVVFGLLPVTKVDGDVIIAGIDQTVFYGGIAGRNIDPVGIMRVCRSLYHNIMNIHLFGNRYKPFAAGGI